jgi:hypothetical protein
LKRNQTDFINNLGIGAFAFLSILEFCSFIQYALRNILILIKTEAKLILWIPEITSLILFLITLIWIINKFDKKVEINTRKTLIKSIIIFFGIILLQYLFSFYGTSYFIDKYFEEYELYHNARKENYELQGYIAFIPILKYLIFGIILLIKRKTVANTVYN